MTLRERIVARLRHWTRRALDRIDPPVPGPRPNSAASSGINATATSASPPRRVTVRCEVTPNPLARKFVVSPAPGWARARSWSGAAEAADDPVGQHLLAVAGVQSVFAVDDFVTVIKTQDADWSQLESGVVAAIEAAL